MKDTKLQLLDITLYDYQYLQNHLTGMAAKGWHLEKLVGMYFWKFRRGEPKRVRYEVIYSSAASAFNSRPTASEEGLADLCAGAGWVRVAALAQMQVYRNEDPDAVPRETDDRQKLANIRRTMKRHFIPQQLLMILLFTLQFCMHGGTVLRHPARTLAAPLMVVTLSMLLIVSLLFAILLLDNLRWLCKARRAVDAGLPIPGNGFYRRFRFFLWIWVALYLGCLFWMSGLNYAGAILGISAIVLVSASGCISLCKRLNAPKWVNMVVPAVVTSVLMIYLLTLFAIGMDRISLSKERPHPESLPLMLSDLADFENAEHTILEETASPLASYGRFWDESGENRLSYTIIDIRCPWFYDMIQKEQEQLFLQSASFHGIDDRNLGYLWGAEYARRAPSANSDRWLICWDSRIVSLKTSRCLTDAQIALAADILKP